MKPFFTSLFLLIIVPCFSQSWQWWATNYNNANNGEELAMATKSNGELAMVLNTDSLRNSSTVELFAQNLLGKRIVRIDRYGNLVHQKAISKNIKRLYYNQNNELLTLVKSAVDSSISYKLFRIGDNLSFIDSTTIITVLNQSDLSSDEHEPQLILTENFIGFISKIQGNYLAEGKSKKGNGYFLGWMGYSGTGGFLKIFTHFVNRNVAIIKDEQPQVAFNKNYLAVLHKSNNGSLYLYNYNLQIPVDSIEIKPSVRFISIANMIGSDHLYALISVKDSTFWYNDTLFQNEWLLKLDQDLKVEKVLDNRNSKYLQSQNNQIGRYLFGGYGKLYVPYPTQTNTILKLSYLSFLIFNDSTHINAEGPLANIQSYNSIGNLEMPRLILPYQGGSYHIFPSLKWHDGQKRLTFYNTESRLNDSTTLNAKNLIMHHTDDAFILKPTYVCQSLKIGLAGRNYLIRNTSWQVNNKPYAVDQDSILLSLNNNEKFTVSCEVTLVTGYVLKVSDNFVFKKPEPSKIEFDTSSICQWNKLSFSAKALSNKSNVYHYVWEFWKNDTVFHSDTMQNTSITFTHPGTYSIRLYQVEKTCSYRVELKDTLKVLPAKVAKISGIPWPVCQGMQLEPNFGTNTSSRKIVWSNGTTDTINRMDSAGAQWVALQIQSPNGCQTQDTFFIKVKPAGGPVVDYIHTQNDLTPTFHFDSNSVYKKIGLERYNPPLLSTFWWKASHSDYSAGLDSIVPQYLVKGIDHCQQETDEAWQPVRLNYNEAIDLLEWNGAKAVPTYIDSLIITNLETNEVKTKPISDARQFDVLEYENHKFQVKAYNASGKLIAISNEWQRDGENPFLLPNAFTPNDDGVNDVFLAYAPGNIKVEKITVFARNGQVVAISSNLKHIWDGTYKGDKLPLGSYNYVIQYTNAKLESKTHYGNVMLIR